MKENNHIPAWLKNLQENSWELELLISGGAIFSLFQVSDLFIDFIFTIKMTSHIPGTGLLTICGMLGIKLLTVGFVTHLLLRAYWLGLVCVNYVFPRGVADKKSNFKKPFVEQYKANDSLQQNITNVDKASGLVMYISILSTIIIVGFLLMVTILITLPSIVFDVNDSYFTFIVWLMLLYYFDLLSFGFLRKIKILSYITYPVLKVLDVIAFRWSYQKSLKLFSSNIVKWKAVIGISVLFFFGLFFTYTSLYRFMHWPNIIDSRSFRMQMTPDNKWIGYAMYMDQLKDENLKISSPVIHTDIVKGNYLKVFIPYDIDYEEGVKQNEYLSGVVILKIDDVQVKNIEWYTYWSKEIDQIGMQAVIDISALTYAKHSITISHKNKLNYISEIPFWRDVTN